MGNMFQAFAVKALFRFQLFQTVIRRLAPTYSLRRARCAARGA